MLTQYTLKMPHVVYSGEGVLDMRLKSSCIQ